MKKFLKKYQLILLLSCILVIIIFIKFSYTDENKVDNGIKTKENIKEIEILVDLEEEYKAEIPIIENEEIDNLEDPIDTNPDYPLISLLPYEGEKFIAEEYISEKVLLMKIKGDSFEESRIEAAEWLIKYEWAPGENTIVWKD